MHYYYSLIDAYFLKVKGEDIVDYIINYHKSCCFVDLQLNLHALILAIAFDSSYYNFYLHNYHLHAKYDHLHFLYIIQDDWLYDSFILSFKILTNLTFYFIKSYFKANLQALLGLRLLLLCLTYFFFT